MIVYNVNYYNGITERTSWMPKSLYWKGHNGTCKFEFPYSPHIEPNSFFN
jgi:hypothetical protein